jgi:hypothetical protein
MTQVHPLFARAAYGPAQLKVLGRAFASASQRLADQGALFTDLEAARTVLAKIIIHLPCSEEDDAERIADAAMGVMLSGHRHGQSVS